MAEGLPASDGGDGASPAARRKLPDESPHEVDGLCSRCGAAWPCLRCLTMTPPYVRIFNNI